MKESAVNFENIFAKQGGIDRPRKQAITLITAVIIRYKYSRL
ncbi:hypothetical protein AC062_0987 [Pasteurellaceae bacterium NI1060]|nr:hypothetical protein AC062_0987 [Pasteurellaceae bacterium NI1060]